MHLSLITKFKSLEPFEIDLPDLVIFTGINGAGKTHILNGIASNQIQITENGRRLSRHKYLAPQSLAPGGEIIITREQLLNQPKQLWEQISSYIQNKQYNPQSKLEHYVGQGTPQFKTIMKISENANKDIDLLTEKDFYDHFPIYELNQSDIFYQSFTLLFKRYHDKYFDNRYLEFLHKEGEKNVKFLSKEEFVKAYGEPPWDFVNKIINEANLNYFINSPGATNKEASFELRLISTVSGVEIGFNDLSSGEKVLMSLALALYNKNLDIDFPEILLMDEPDAPLHPSMSKQFLDVIKEVFVKEKGVKVIISTHSASTVALAPEESIFIVNKNLPRIEKASKDKALKVLTTGVPSFSVNYENRRQVFVESPNDVLFYEKLYRFLIYRLEPEISLSFISSGDTRTDKNGIKVSNCDQVINVTEVLRNAGNKFVLGLIDWDQKNVSTEHIKVVGEGARYAIESYILDPLLLAALLLREKIIEKEVFGLNLEENYLSIKIFSIERLQNLVDKITQAVLPEINDPDMTQVPVKLINGVVLTLPKWYIHYYGHGLEEKLIKVFPKLNEIKRGKEEALKLAIIDKIIEDMPELLSEDILLAFRWLQEN